jgi:hypothetical protein
MAFHRPASKAYLRKLYRIPMLPLSCDCRVERALGAAIGLGAPRVGDIARFEV